MSDNKHQLRDDQRGSAMLNWDDAPPADTPQQVRHGDVPSIEFTLRQAEALVEVFGGYDALASVMERPAAWTDMDPGLYAYFSEYPEEGSMYLGPTEVDDDLATDGRAPAAPIKTWRERIGQPAEYPLHAPTDVERAMEAEIADLRSQLESQGSTEGTRIGHVTAPDEGELRAEFVRQHKGRNLRQHHMRGTYTSAPIAALWNQHRRTAKWMAGRAPEAAHAQQDAAPVAKVEQPVCRNCIDQGWEPSIGGERRPCGFCKQSQGSGENGGDA